jgi:hypothetical protein
MGNPTNPILMSFVGRIEVIMIVTESSKIEKAFTAAKNGKAVHFRTQEWKLVRKMASQAGLKVLGIWGVDRYPIRETDGCPEDFVVKNNVVLFIYN